MQEITIHHRLGSMSFGLKVAFAIFVGFLALSASGLILGYQLEHINSQNMAKSDTSVRNFSIVFYELSKIAAFIIAGFLIGVKGPMRWSLWILGFAIWALNATTLYTSRWGIVEKQSNSQSLQSSMIEELERQRINASSSADEERKQFNSWMNSSTESSKSAARMAILERKSSATTETSSKDFLIAADSQKKEADKHSAQAKLHDAEVTRLSNEILKARSAKTVTTDEGLLGSRGARFIAIAEIIILSLIDLAMWAVFSAAVTALVVSIPKGVERKLSPVAPVMP